MVASYFQVQTPTAGLPRPTRQQGEGQNVDTVIFLLIVVEPLRNT